MPTDTPPRPRGRRDPAAPVERRNRDRSVIEAAIEVMSERGYAATSVQDIAERVGVLKGSLYHYFSSKEELLFRVISESYDESQRITREVADLGLEPLAELAEFLRRQSLWYLSHVERANIYFTESRHLTGERQTVTQQRGREFVQHLHVLIEGAQAQHAIRSELDPALLTRYVTGSLNSVRTWPRRSKPTFTAEQMADAFVALTLSAVQAD